MADVAAGRTSRRILIYGNNYSPETTGIAPYTTHAAEFLAARGNQVQVIAGFPHYPSWRVPEQYRGTCSSTESLNNVELTRVRHYVPPRQTTIQRAAYELTFGLHAAAKRPRSRPEVVIAVVPTLLSAVTAAVVAARASANFVVWVQDSMASAARQSGIDGGARSAQGIEFIENFVYRRSDVIIVIAERFASDLVKKGFPREKIRIIPNWAHVVNNASPKDILRSRLFGASTDAVVLHTGNMGLKQGLENVVYAAKIASKTDAPVRFVLLGDGSQKESLTSLGRGVPKLTFMDPVSDEDYPAVLGAGDILLVHERAGVDNMSLPSKLTSYFSAGRPVLAAVDPHGTTAMEISRSGAGLVVDNQSPEKLVQAAIDLAKDAGNRSRLGDNGRIYASEHLSANASLSALAAIVERKE